MLIAYQMYNNYTFDILYQTRSASKVKFDSVRIDNVCDVLYG